MIHETFISEHADGWYFYDPNVRGDGFGPLTMEEAEGVKHVVDATRTRGRHLFTSCPLNTRAMCSWEQHVKDAARDCPELRLVLDQF